MGIYAELQSGRWAEANPSVCPCRGRGWFLSDFDSWHQCQIHGRGCEAPHPEDDDSRVEVRPFINVQRGAYCFFRDRARAAGFDGNFRDACAAVLAKDNIVHPTPANWVDAAEAVADALRTEAEERRARRSGFSCALEMRLADEAVREAEERRGVC